MEKVTWQYSYDPVANAEYIAIGRERTMGKLKEPPVAETKVMRDGLNIDLDATGNIIGVEIINGDPKYR